MQCNLEHAAVASSLQSCETSANSWYHYHHGDQCSLLRPGWKTMVEWCPRGAVPSELPWLWLMMQLVICVLATQSIE